jgi:PD-(D/E)XK nuclease superfamily protein
MKWQQSSGTAEQKVPFEIICLAETIKETPNYKRGYVVLGGTGWTLQEYYI